jgi:hypothetical protein
MSGRAIRMEARTAAFRAWLRALEAAPCTQNVNNGQDTPAANGGAEAGRARPSEVARVG